MPASEFCDHFTFSHVRQADHALDHLIWPPPLPTLSDRRHVDDPEPISGLLIPVKWSRACSLFDCQKKKILNEKEGKVEQKKREEGDMETYQYVHEDKEEEEEEDTL